MRIPIGRFVAVVVLTTLAGFAVGCAKRAQVAPPELPPTPPVVTPEVTPPPPPPPPPPAPTVAPTITSSDFRPAFFDFDKSNLRPDAQAALDADAKLLRDNADIKVTIEGHCDERGTTEYNLALGERRAQAARDYLVAAGISASRIEIVSYGEERPFDPGHNEGAWTQNRRAQVVVRP
ncbi:MAG: peptidoglycan-associated lipoprotein [Candidatus Eisenbacteria bacterium RBG_19FT_COMBO_70_11]|nr:MAG: peptidoglycan-associated lipoprotein [Candidatus Eisenbacteria bacterium RBG_19FT_COMBO_70_11]